MKKKSIIKIMGISIIIIICLSYLWSKSTYTAYESSIGGETSPSIGGWNILVNNNNLNDLDASRTIGIDDISWDTTHVREGKVAPGSTGNMNINIDGTGTDVSVRFDLTITDKNVDPNKLLRVTEVRGLNCTIIKTGVDTYSFILSYNSIMSLIKPKILLSVIWDDEDITFDQNDIGEDSDNLSINLNAVQYKGEEIVPYTG